MSKAPKNTRSWREIIESSGKGELFADLSDIDGLRLPANDKLKAFEEMGVGSRTAARISANFGQSGLLMKTARAGGLLGALYLGGKGVSNVVKGVSGSVIEVDPLTERETRADAGTAITGAGQLGLAAMAAYYAALHGGANKAIGV